MPDNSTLLYGFAFLTPTGRPVRSTPKKIRALYRFFNSGGQDNDVEGVHVVARWRNPDDKAARSREWKTTDDAGQSLEDFHDTLHGSRGALSRAEYKAMEDFQMLELYEALKKDFRKLAREHDRLQNAYDQTLLDLGEAQREIEKLERKYDKAVARSSAVPRAKAKKSSGSRR